VGERLDCPSGVRGASGSSLLTAVPAVDLWMSSPVILIPGLAAWQRMAALQRGAGAEVPAWALHSTSSEGGVARSVTTQKCRWRLSAIVVPSSRGDRDRESVQAGTGLSRGGAPRVCNAPRVAVGAALAPGHGPQADRASLGHLGRHRLPAPSRAEGVRAGGSAAGQQPQREQPQRWRKRRDGASAR
jgi:hypothetical protein